jgi:type IV pilus assembly protein PilY1
VHGDVIHSRPAVVNYGGTTGVVVFYGDNGGMFHAVNGNQPAGANCTVSADCQIGGVQPGGELWSFVPTEFYSKLARLYLNSPVVKIASTPLNITPTPQRKDYFFDGTPAMYQNGSTVYLYLSARRGGRLIYGLDVSDPTAPKLLWKRTNADSGFAELGQTWSQPKVARVHGYNNPVLIFGAGYDANEDNEPATPDTMGRGIFIVDAFDGHVVWRAGYSASAPATKCSGNPCNLNMPYAIAADITLVDRNFDGYADRLYAADTGGNIWRVDLEPTSPTNGPSNWQVTLFASLGGAAADTTRRKFLYPPDVVLTKTFDAVLGGTGDREHPLLNQVADTVVNRFYMIKDTNVGTDGSGWTAVKDDSSSITSGAPTSSLFDATSTPYPATLLKSTSSAGFYLVLNQGEKVVNAPTTVGAYTYFGTNQPKPPDPNSCSIDLGTARGYQVSWLTGSAVSGIFDGGGLPPSPVFGIVRISVNGTDMRVPFLFGGPPTSDCKSGLCVTKPAIPINPVKKRTYWYREVDR